jgi:hypothetical protein
MGWVRLDDNFADHPKIIGISDSAFRLYVASLCYANRQLTDGFIPAPAYGVLSRNDDAPELCAAGLWRAVTGGFQIRSYEEYQPTRNEIENKRNAARDRLSKYRETQKKRVSGAFQYDDGNAEETPPPTQPNPTQPNSLDIYISKEVEGYESHDAIPLPRVKTARDAVARISNKLAEGKVAGVNAWNLSRLVEEEWDAIHNANDPVDVGGLTALTVWYVSELQSRKLTSAEIGRIGQMTKRFGRIALMAIDEAASKDLDDLVSYAFRIAQRMYADRKA